MTRPAKANSAINGAVGRHPSTGRRRASANAAATLTVGQRGVSRRTVRHLRTIFDLTAAETRHLIDLGLRLKTEREQGVDQRLVPGPVLGLLFEKPSLRTRVSFEAAVAHLGGAAVFLSGHEVGLGQRESVADFAHVMSGYVDLLAIRTFSQSLVDDLAHYADCPVINALSDTDHPCQALGDLCAAREVFGRLDGLRVAFVGDANNVARSLAEASVYCGINFVLSAPRGYHFDEAFLERCRKTGAPGSIAIEADPRRAVVDADVVYTDVWTSMGQEKEEKARRRAFAKYQVDERLMALAKPTARFMHCLPAKRGDEVTAAVIDGPASIVFKQSAYRLHAQKALMYWLLREAGANR